MASRELLRRDQIHSNMVSRHGSDRLKAAEQRRQVVVGELGKPTAGQPAPALPELLDQRLAS